MQFYIAIALAISFLWGVQPVIHKHLLKKFTPITLMLVSSIVYFALLIVTSVIKNKEVIADFEKMTAKDLGILVALSIFTAFLANIMYYYILKDHESSIISALIYSSPVFTLAIAYLFLKERLDIYGFSGIMAIIVGVILISQNNQSSRHLEFLTNK
jgi:drug/metabolite transporter (DMT)-like permease